MLAMSSTLLDRISQLCNIYERIEYAMRFKVGRQSRPSTACSSRTCRVRKRGHAAKTVLVNHTTETIATVNTKFAR